jgi:hypothetical protein
MCLIFVVPVAAADTVNVTINGQAVSFQDQAPAIVGGRTLVPVRGVFEALGFTVDWDAPASTATLSGNGFVVLITVGSADFTTNGVRHSLDVPAQIIGGRTMLPIRAVLESVGYTVGWDGGTNTVIVSSAPPDAEPPAPTTRNEEFVLQGGLHVANFIESVSFDYWGYGRWFGEVLFLNAPATITATRDIVLNDFLYAHGYIDELAPLVKIRLPAGANYRDYLRDSTIIATYESVPFNFELRIEEGELWDIWDADLVRIFPEGASITLNEGFFRLLHAGTMSQIFIVVR